MNKFLVVAVIAGGFLVLYGVGRMWNLKPETTYSHTLHRGEAAVLVAPAGSEVWLAKKEDDSYHVQVAMGKNDVEWLRGAAVSVPAGTMVKVLHETESRRQVEVTSGPQARQQGWVEQEYLRPPRQGELK